MARKLLSDLIVRRLKPPAPGQRIAVWDSLVDGFGVRVTAFSRVYVMRARFPRMKTAQGWVDNLNKSTVRTIGSSGKLSLARARDIAKGWQDALSRGLDPTEAQERAEAQRQTVEARERSHKWHQVAADYVAHLRRQKLRRANDVESYLRRETMGHRRQADEWVDGEDPLWRDRSISSITRGDVTKLIVAILDRSGELTDRHYRRLSGGPNAARHTFAAIRGVFLFAAERDYGLGDIVPTDRIRIARLVGPAPLRTHVLTNDELRWFWRGAAHDEVFGPLGQFLLLTGARLNEAAGCRWGEFIDLGGDGPVWHVPAERMKSKVVHDAPLAAPTVSLLRSLPRYQGKGAGNFVFTTTRGLVPLQGFSRALDRLRRLAADEREKDAAEVRRAGRPDPQPISRFGFHDLRRSMRSHLSALPVEEHVRELCIAHQKRGLSRVYDQHRYRDEMRRAMTLWAERLLGIVENTGNGNLTPLHAEVA